MNTKSEIRQEYLLILKKTELNIDSQSIINILQESLHNIEIEEGFLTYRDIKFNFLISQKNKESNDYVFFVICISGREEQLIQLNELTYRIDSWIDENKEKLEENIKSISYLWDGISFHYSKEIYSLIHRLENHARKFIICHIQTKLQSSQPTETPSKSIEKHTKNWIDSANFLFTPEIDLEKIGELKKLSIRTTKDDKDKKVKRIEITEAIRKLHEQTKTGLERLFPEKTFSTQDNMYEKWEALQSFRDKVAHNKGHLRSNDMKSVDELVSFFTKTFDEISKLCQCNDEAELDKKTTLHTQDSSFNDSQLAEADAELWEQLNSIRTIDYNEILEEEAKNKQYKTEKGVLVDTNETYGEGSLWDMFENDYVALYGDAVNQLNYLNENDIVFFYLKGRGIIAAAKLEPGEITEYDDWCHFKPVKFLTKKPDTKRKIIENVISVQKIREFTGKNFFWARTLKVPYLSSDEANNLLNKIIPILGKADDTNN